MRVIAGEARGRRLRAPQGSAVRPTSDRAREAMFSSLGAAVAGARVLDLFAGTGAVGIEALSRGATAATFVDSDRAATETVNANLATTGLADRAVVVRNDAARFCRAPRGGPFDVVFCDPPYARPLDEVIAMLGELAGFGGLADAAVVVLERDKRDAALAATVDVPGVLVEDRRRSYGDTVLVYLRAVPPPSPDPRDPEPP